MNKPRAKKKGRSVIQLPFADEEGKTSRQTVEGLARRALSTWKIRTPIVKPSTIVVRLIGSSKRSRSLLRAFAEQRAANALGDPAYHNEDPTYLAGLEESGVTPRYRMEVGPVNTEWWDTEMNRRKAEGASQNIDFCPLPSEEVDRVKNNAIPVSVKVVVHFSGAFLDRLFELLVV